MTQQDYEFWAASAAVRAQDTHAGIFDVVDDHAGSQEAGFNRGFSTSFRLKPGTSTWFHVPIPTPALIAGQKLVLTRLSLLWFTEDDLQLSWATAHIGGARRMELSTRATPIEGVVDTDLEMPHGLKVTTLRKDFPLDQPVPVDMGVQLCLHAEASPDGNGGTFRFYGAGASFSAA